MIYLGFRNDEKQAIIRESASRIGAKKIVILSPEKFNFTFESGIPFEFVDWPDIISYVFYYRLLQEIDKNTLIVVNECLRSQNRYDLTYNCIRHYLNQSGAVLVFQYMPLIDTIEDFMVLYDFDTGSKWKREKFGAVDLHECRLRINPVVPRFNFVQVKTSQARKDAYKDEKEKLFAQLSESTDPHTLPRNLYNWTGKDRLQGIDLQRPWVCRNKRLKVENMVTYKDVTGSFPDPYGVFEFCHRFIDFSDFMFVSGQTKFDVLTANQPVDHWYQQRFTEWAGRIEDAYASLS